MTPQPELRMVHSCHKCKLTKLVAETLWRQLVLQGWKVSVAGKAMCPECVVKFPNEVHTPPVRYSGSSKVEATFHHGFLDGDTGAGSPAL